MDGLDNLNHIGGQLFIGSNENMGSLSGMHSLTTIGGKLFIVDNPPLESLSGLENIQAGSISQLEIWDNPNLYECAVQSICDYLASPNGTINISNNASGCNSPEEVIQACQGISVEEINPEACISIIPNPATGIITISHPVLAGTALLSIFNTGGGKVLESQLNNAETRIDISALPRGVYFVRLQNEKMVEVGKIIKE